MAEIDGSEGQGAAQGQRWFKRIPAQSAVAQPITRSDAVGGFTGRLRGLVIFGALVCMVSTSEIQAQERVVVSSRQHCPRCRVELTRVARLGHPGDPRSVGGSVVVARDSRGRYYVSTAFHPGEILVYDSRGKYLRSVGRPGRGPQEFRRIFFMAVSAGDTLHVFDVGNRGHSILSPSYQVVRSNSIPGIVYDALVEENGTVILQAPVPRPETVGFPVHVVSPGGRILRSLGAADGRAYRESDPGSEYRPLGHAGRGRIWISHLNRYEVELWSTQGRHLKTFARDASWFRPWNTAPERSPVESRPRPAVVDVRQDREARLWVITSVADRNWKRGRVAGSGEEAKVPPVTEMDRYFDTLVEVIDIRTGRLLKTARLPYRPFKFLSGDLVFRAVEDASGHTYVDILRVRLLTS